MDENEIGETTGESYDQPTAANAGGKSIVGVTLVFIDKKYATLSRVFCSAQLEGKSEKYFDTRLGKYGAHIVLIIPELQ